MRPPTKLHHLSSIMKIPPFFFEAASPHPVLFYSPFFSPLQAFQCCVIYTSGGGRINSRWRIWSSPPPPFTPCIQFCIPLMVRPTLGCAQNTMHTLFEHGHVPCKRPQVQLVFPIPSPLGNIGTICSLPRYTILPHLRISDNMCRVPVYPPSYRPNPINKDSFHHPPFFLSAR